MYPRRADARLRRAQARCKQKYDKRIRFEQNYTAEDYAFVYRPSPKTSPLEKLPSESYINLLSRRLVPYFVLHVGPKFMQGLQHGIENVESVNRISPAFKKEYKGDTQRLKKLTKRSTK